MKKFMISLILAALFTDGTTVIAQENQEDRLGLPGDNLNLYAVMKLFQESKTLEGFEKSLNNENNRINNLDLNGDNMVDYIKVNDYIDGDVHNIVLQVAVNERENQDVAVFTVQRFPNGQVQIQLTGDEELYGRDYIIEPIYDDENQNLTPNPGYTGGINGRNIIVTRTSPVMIASWPVIRFIYAPRYVVWRSPWDWSYYPSFWHPWQPLYWHYYYGYHYNWYNNYYGHYRRWQDHRYTRWNDFYYASRRSHSPYVNLRIRDGNYRNTYSHPDQRRDGEALFTKMHPDQSRRSPVNSSGTRSNIRPDSRSNPGRQSIGNTTSTTRRSNTTVTNRSYTDRPSVQNRGTTRRSSATVNNKPVSRSGSDRNVVTNRTSRQTTSTGVSSSNRRTGKTTKAVTTVKKDKDKKESVTNKDTRRK
jgi:hypothetical protein